MWSVRCAVCCARMHERARAHRAHVCCAECMLRVGGGRNTILVLCQVRLLQLLRSERVDTRQVSEVSILGDGLVDTCGLFWLAAEVSVLATYPLRRWVILPLFFPRKKYPLPGPVTAELCTIEQI